MTQPHASRSPVASLLLTLTLVSGCLSAKYEDVSSVAPYAGLIGCAYASNIPVDAFGIAGDSTLNSTVEHYILRPPPGIAGRKIISRQHLPANTRINVQSVRRCTNCLTWGLERFDLVVRVEGQPLFGDTPIYLGLRHISSFRRLAADLLLAPYVLGREQKEPACDPARFAAAV